MELYERRNLSATLDNWFASRSTAFDGFTAATATTVIFFFPHRQSDRFFVLLETFFV